MTKGNPQVKPGAKNSDSSASSEWFRSSDVTATGVISGNTFDRRLVEYSVIDGKAIFEGDILLGSNNLEEQSARVAADDQVVSGVARRGDEFRWPDGLIPWQSQTALRQRVLDAIRHWETNTNIRFVERVGANAAEHANYVSFESRDGCWSQVGMQGGEQVVSLGDGCGFGSAVHEIGHVVGLWHEQSRADRDRHIRVVWENIQEGREHNFNQHLTDGDDIGPYDYDSIMHYPATAFSRNNQATIISLNQQPIGQRRGLSVGDIAAANALYPTSPAQSAKVGIQFQGVLQPRATRLWVTDSWPENWFVVWLVVPIEPSQSPGAQIEWKIMLERQTETLVSYYVWVKNQTAASVSIEARYMILEG